MFLKPAIEHKNKALKQNILCFILYICEYIVAKRK